MDLQARLVNELMAFASDHACTVVCVLSSCQPWAVDIGCAVHFERNITVCCMQVKKRIAVVQWREAREAERAAAKATAELESADSREARAQRQKQQQVRRPLQRLRVLRSR